MPSPISRPGWRRRQQQFRVPGRAVAVNGGTETVVPPSGNNNDKDQPVKKRRDSDGGAQPSGGHGGVNGHSEGGTRRAMRNDEVVEVLPQEDEGFPAKHSHMKYELRDTPGLVPIGLNGLQHYISMLGSLLLIPLVIVPAMGGTQEDTSMVVSTVLFISGVRTLFSLRLSDRGCR
ncbi:unnamed protein product [Linum trigynum]|uniref:Uncharacterized protein n=1 Tax=Linum trigynum TaxID=586398 RepID=A0AAV2D4B6_9ROSI